MDQAALAGAGDTKKNGVFRMGMKGLMVLVASCALIIWAGLSIRDHLEGYQPLHVIRSGNAFDRRKAAQELSVEGSIDPAAAMTALMETLGDEDAEVRAMAAGSLAMRSSRVESPAWCADTLGFAQDPDRCRDARWFP